MQLDPTTLTDAKHPVVVEKNSDTVTLHLSKIATYLGIGSVVVGAAITAAGFVFASAQLVSKLDDLGKSVSQLTLRLDKQESSDLEFWKDKWPNVEGLVKQANGDHERIDKLETRTQSIDIDVSALRAGVVDIKERIKRVEEKR